MAKNDTSQQSFSGGKVEYSEVETAKTSMGDVAKVSGNEGANLHDNPSGNGVPSNKDYYPG